jgi:flagellar motor switch protein FliG
MSVTAQDYASLTGPQKAAILILALGDEQGGKLFSLLHED